MGSPNSSSDFKQLVLDATDIAELIGQTVALKRRGKDFLGLCPFHQDKNPSFYVIPAKRIYHCFACKASGNAIDFVMHRDRVEFLEAVRTLAERAGIDMPRRGEDSGQAGERKQLLEAHSVACAFFENQFHNTPAGAPAREYMEKRGFTLETLRQFRVGMAPESWDALLKSPTMRKFPPALMALGGLAKPRQSGNGHYDTFRNRIMFPIFNRADAQIIAFGGRVMPGSEDPAKYLNSPETPLFSKSSCVFGLNFAKQRIIDTDTAVVVEGYTDVMMAHQFGASNVVSILGTAMTPQHVGLLKQYGKKIVLLFDADEAGDKAADRAVELFLHHDVEISVATMPDGMDPDEFLLMHGKDAFEAVVRNGLDVLSYKWSQLVRRFGAAGDEVTAQQQALGPYFELLRSAQLAGSVDPMRLGAVMARVNRLTGIPMDELYRLLGKVKPSGSPARFDAASGRGRVPSATAEAPVTTPESPTMKVVMAREMAEGQILGILLKEPRRWHTVQVALHAEDFSEGSRRTLAEAYWHHQLDEGEPEFSTFLGLLEDPVKNLAVELMMEADQLLDVDETLKHALDYFAEERKRVAYEKQIVELQRSTHQGAADAQLAEQFAKIVQTTPAKDLRRLGPVRRLKQSGS